MMIKFVGSVIVIAALYAYGWYMAEYTKKRADELMELKKALMLFSAETVYTGGTLCEIFENIGKRCTGTVRDIFIGAAELLYGKGAESAFAAWEEAVDKCIGKSFMVAEDIKNIKAFGRCLGFSDERGQLSNADITVNYLDDKNMELKETYREQKRLYKSLGAMVGLLIVVVIF